MTLTIEAGKFYRARDGRKVGPMAPYDHHPLEWTDGNLVWTEGGAYWRFGPVSHLDLVSEWVDEPSQSPTEDEKLAAEGWIKHDGKGMPVDGGAVVLPRYRDRADVHPGFADDWVGWDWIEADNPDEQITHYRIASPNTDRAQVEALGKVADVPDAAIEALKPFAALGQYLIDTGFTTKPDGADVWGFDGNTLTYGDFRRAAKTYADAMLAERAKK